MSKRPAKEPSKDQARVFLNTVISPMIRALTVETDALSAKNPTFRAHSLDFEFLWGSESMLSHPHLPNLKLFYYFFPEIQKAAARHDVCIGQLRDACAAAFEQLLKTGEFLTLVGDRTSSERRSLAEYVVDGHDELPDFYSLCHVWNSQASAYLALRKIPALSPLFEAVNQAALELQKAVAKLVSQLQQLQMKLAIDHGLAPVDPALSGT